MQKYQMLYIIDSSLQDEQREETMKKVEAIIVKNGGVVENVEKSGLKTFAYPINYKREGFYVLVNFNAEPTAPVEIEKQLNITDNIVRQMIVSK